MKKSELRQIIKEEISKVLNENISDDGIDPNDLELFRGGELEEFKFFSSSTIKSYKNIGKNVPRDVITQFLYQYRNDPKFNSWIYNEYFERANDELELGFDETDEISRMAMYDDESWRRAFANQVIKQTQEKIGKGFKGSDEAEYRVVRIIIKKAYDDNNPF